MASHPNDTGAPDASTSPALAIIVPTLNEALTIEANLRALAPLIARGVEVIVVDGGSQDATRRLAAPLASRLAVGERGRAHQMNAGARLTRARALLFLHADTRLPEGADNLVAEALADRHRWGRFDVRLSGRHPMLAVIASAMNLRSRLTGIATGDQALFMTRAAYEAVGGFPNQPLMEDIEISRRLKRQSPPACLHARVTSSGRRWETHGVWRTVRLMWRLRWDYWRGTPVARLAKAYRDAR
ncbi:TIGR04283 family arsenosugar biosynthesis glycosyltransferase [Halomonas sp. THAF12]|uniref:TIGR04283 family arsenosugar biosynthesis glycosyltransferase n=1 Tax=Halomonas sp. B23F22_10 TaxID=3459515 RepID=UPI00373F36EE